MWVMVIGVAFIGIFTSWFGTQSFAVKLLNTGTQDARRKSPECSQKKQARLSAGSPLTASVCPCVCAAGGKQLGSWLIGIVYVVFILSNQVAPSIVGLIGAKWTMVAGSVGYFLVVAGTASQNAHLTLVGGACVGFGAGLLWSGQGRMVTDLSTDSTRGFCWGIFDALMMGGSGYALHRCCCCARPRQNDSIGMPAFLNSFVNRLVGNAITINFAPSSKMPDASSSSSGSAGASDHEFDEEVRKYFTILCIPVSIAIIVLMCIPNLPKPTEQLSVSGRMQKVRKHAARAIWVLLPRCLVVVPRA